MRLISDFEERQILKKKILENFSENENFYFAKIQDRMYEKHESYGVLKLSKQALQKGKILNYGSSLFWIVENTFGTDPNSSE